MTQGESEGPFKRNFTNRTPAHSPMATATAVVAEVHVLESASTSAPSSQAPDVPEVTQTIDGLHPSLSAEREAWQKERSEMNNEIKKSRALLAVSESTMQLLQDENVELSGRLEGLIDTRESLRNENAVLSKKIQILTEELKTVRNENLELSNIAEGNMHSTKNGHTQRLEATLHEMGLRLKAAECALEEKSQSEAAVVAQFTSFLVRAMVGTRASRNRRFST